MTPDEEFHAKEALRDQKIKAALAKCEQAVCDLDWGDVNRVAAMLRALRGSPVS